MIPFAQMTAAGLERGLNHVLLQSPGATEALRRHVGAQIRFDLILAQFDFRIADDGCLSETAGDAPDAVIRPTPALLARLPVAGRDALRLADFSGDPALLQTLDSVFRRLKWDLEADLAPHIGDLAAHRISAFGRDALTGVQGAVAAVATNASEYVVEEAEWMARAVDVDRFNAAVDTLTEDAARLEARLQLLEAPAERP